MEKIAILTDSGADLSQEFIRENNIYVVNLYVIIDDEYFIDKENISPIDIKRLNEANSSFSAKTSAPSAHDFSNVFKKIKEDGYDKAIYIGLTPKLSSTFSNANLADKHGLEVEMVDSGSVTLLEGLIVLYTLDLIKDGYSFCEVASKVRNVVGNQKAYTWMDTIKYLKAGGRLGRAAKRVSSIINLKPLLSLDGKGDFDLIKLKVKKEKSIDIIEEKIRQDLANVKKYYLMYLSGTEESILDNIKERLKDIENKSEYTLTSAFGSAITVHSGAKAYAVGYLKIDE